jgi:hypothetical protein
VTHYTGERRVYVVRSGPERPIAIHLLTYLFLGTSALYVLLTSTVRPSRWPLSPWEFIYVEGGDMWFYYILWHPCFAILWGAFIAAAAVQFYRLRKWGRAALEVATWLALLVIAVAAFVPVYVIYTAHVVEAGLVSLVCLAVGSVLCLLCLFIIGALRSPKVRAAMVHRRPPR